MFKAPDGYYLHSIDDVLKYYQKHKMLQQFSESIRKGFVAAQQEAKSVHSKHMQKVAKFLFPMPEIPAPTIRTSWSGGVASMASSLLLTRT